MYLFIFFYALFFTPLASNPISDPGQHYANQERSEENTKNKQKESKKEETPTIMHNVGIVDPGVGFEPVEVEWIKPVEKQENIENTVKIEKEVKIDENDPDVCIIGELGPDQLKDCDNGFIENEDDQRRT